MPHRWTNKRKEATNNNLELLFFYVYHISSPHLLFLVQRVLSRVKVKELATGEINQGEEEKERKKKKREIRESSTCRDGHERDGHNWRKKSEALMPGAKEKGKASQKKR